MSDMVENDIMYGILMRKTSINEETHIFTPVHLIKGIMVSDYIFTDELGNDYDIIDIEKPFQDYLYLEDEYYIGYNITEKQLLSIYSDEILENAKMHLFESLKNDCILAMYNEESYEYSIMYLKLNNINSNFKSTLNNMKDNDSNATNKSSDNINETEFTAVLKDKSSLKEGQPILILTEDDLNECMGLCEKKEYEKLIKLLKEYQDTLAKSETDNSEPVIEEEIEEKKDDTSIDTIDVNKFYEETKRKIIGQDEAIKDVISAVKMDQYSKTSSERTRCFIMGPTGTGKTEIVKCLGEYLDKPSIKIDTTQLTVPGYVGGTLEDSLARLVNVAGGDVNKAENGIITFDEIDKKCGNEDKLFGQGFLYTLLPFLDGTDYTINVNGKKVNFNTSKLTIFASGSFSEIMKNASLDKKSIGFGAKDVPCKSDVTNPEEIFRIASMPEEIIGRFPVVVRLNPHTEQSLSKILTDSDISQLKSEKRKFECLGVNLNWEDKYIEAVAREAIKLNIGARSLKKIVERTIKELRWEILTNPNKYSEAILLEETVNNPHTYKLK